jgi:uncharacterized sulfatase
MQGEPFLGKSATKAREGVYGIRDRMDERNDTTRAVRERRYKYIRNYQWFRPWAQPLAYIDFMPTMQAWRVLQSEGTDRSAERSMAPTSLSKNCMTRRADLRSCADIVDDFQISTVESRLRKRHIEWYRTTPIWD